MSSFIDINGTGLAYEVIGEGKEAIFFLNGVAMTMAHWKPLLPGLTSNSRFVLHDFRGQLMSEKPREEYSLAGHAEDLCALMDELGISHAHLVGTSYGSEVAMEFAILYPHKVDSLVLIDGVSELDPVLKSAVESWQLTAEADPRLFYRTIIPWNYSPGYLEENLGKLREREESISKLPQEYFDGFCRLCDSFLKIDLTERLKEIMAPALVLVGEKDILKHRGFSEIINSAIPQSWMEIIPDAGHAVVIEQPEVVAKRINRFMEVISS
ncbi:alpha/beta fold hydrolase [Spirochaeta isovalerica]|uniref:3-oxoadipate enol-lactonase n=1 Tax=Spirochaeta isovalerica TaxID=150 RepID=A0A841REN0_9SPIO|nr:alpha/beta hydrolase [Spirochaeta isovalerica]MBB6482535.1 3-oxoadipate enol-lactonase [Spirochaeta isovalerica]